MDLQTPACIMGNKLSSCRKDRSVPSSAIPEEKESAPGERSFHGGFILLTIQLLAEDLQVLFFSSFKRLHTWWSTSFCFIHTAKGLGSPIPKIATGRNPNPTLILTRERLQSSIFQAPMKISDRDWESWIHWKRSPHGDLWHFCRHKKLFALRCAVISPMFADQVTLCSDMRCGYFRGSFNGHPLPWFFVQRALSSFVFRWVLQWRIDRGFRNFFRRNLYYFHRGGNQGSYNIGTA